ncbi:MAG: hypothetical protein DME26_19470 [Verrucomicrobia bacterium]|nr:MAG: hypothetical protein DME26_19470 [Verrucomicrobiota bacterium]
MRGIWSQFAPAILLLLTLWVYVGLDFGYQLNDYERGWMRQLWFFTTTCLTLPAIGLYFSLRYQNFLIATIATLTIGFLLPLSIATVMSVGVYLLSEKLFVRIPDIWLFTTEALYVSCFCQILVAWILGQLLVRNLTNRTFAFQRGGA